MTYDPIAESLPYDSVILDGGTTQPAYHAVVHLLVPCFDRNGNPVDSEAAAQDYVSETLRGLFLDWGYVRATDPETGEAIEGEEGMQSPIPITVCRPYIEGTFGNEGNGDEEHTSCDDCGRSLTTGDDGDDYVVAGPDGGIFCASCAKKLT